VKIKALLDNAAECRRSAAPLMLGGHADQAAPWMEAAIMDSLLALALIARASEAGARVRAANFRDVLEDVIERIPQAAGEPLGTLSFKPEPATEPGTPEAACDPTRLRWLADRLLDCSWDSRVTSEASQALRAAARQLVGSTTTAAPGSESPAPELDRGAELAPPPETLKPHVFTPAANGAVCERCGLSNLASIHSEAFRRA
jgi:hypothetical protein